LLEVPLGVHLNNEKIKTKCRVEETQPRLLVIDSEVQLRQVVSEALKGNSCQLVFAESAVQMDNALLENSRYDVVLMALYDPVERVFELMASIKEHSPRTEVILISRLADMPLWIESVRRGAYDLLPIPLDQKELLRIVRGALKRANHPEVLAIAEAENSSRK
jgi:DNA-binding NtrC family response regulator